MSLQETECNVTSRDNIHVFEDTDIEVLGEVQDTAKGGYILGDVEVISHLNIINVTKIKELLEWMGKPKNRKGEHTNNQAQPEVDEGAQRVEHA